MIPKEREKTRKGRQVPLSTKALGRLAELKMHRVKGEPRVLATLPAVTSALGADSSEPPNVLIVQTCIFMTCGAKL